MKNQRHHRAFVAYRVVLFGANYLAFVRLENEATWVLLTVAVIAIAAYTLSYNLEDRTT